jgi:heme A synthase
LLLLVEALLGAALVKFGLVVKDASPARAVVLSIHLANTLALLAALALTAWWGGGRKRVSWSGRAWASLAGVAALGITGALSALADTLFPAPSLAAGLAQDWNSGANWLVHLRGLHPVLALAVGGWVVYFSFSRMGGARRLALATVGLVAAQIELGIMNLAALTPLWMQVAHLLAADLLWIALVLLCEASA